MSTVQSGAADHEPRIGKRAPDFTLPATTGDSVTLSQYRGHKRVVLAFLPYAFAPACTAALRAYEAERTRFAALDTAVLGISLDGRYALLERSRQLSLSYPLLSDAYPYAHVARLYGLHPSTEAAEGAIVVVDTDGRLIWQRIQGLNGEAPNFDEVFTVLRRGVRRVAPDRLAS